MAQIHGPRLKYLRNGFTMLEMAEEFEKRLICVGNDVCMWEVAYVFKKRLNMWEMTQICGKQLKYIGNGLNTSQADKICRN